MTLELPGHWSHRQKLFLFLGLLMATLLLMAALNALGQPLVTNAAPAGIVSYELARTEAQAEKILNSWSQETRMLAAFNLGLDYLFLLFYSTTIAFGLAWVISLWQPGGALTTVLKLLLIGQWLAAALDGIENAALLAILVQEIDPLLTEIAFWAAAFKFVLVGVGIAIAAGGLLARLLWVRLKRSH